jgi:hypothetical protein
MWMHKVQVGLSAEGDACAMWWLPRAHARLNRARRSWDLACAVNTAGPAWSRAVHTATVHNAERAENEY